MNVTNDNDKKHRTYRTMSVCSKIDCMPCKITDTSTCFNLSILSTEKCSFMPFVETHAKTPSPNIRNHKLSLGK